MKLLSALAFFLAALSSPAHPSDVTLPGRWSVEKANDWYQKQPWWVGCNFTPSTAINQIEMWQAETQTQYPWSSWRKEFTAEPDLWHHDVLRPDGTPFKASEVELIRDLTGGK